MRQPRTRFIRLAPRPSASALIGMRAGLHAVAALVSVGVAIFLMEALRPALVALLVGALVPALPPVSPRAAGMPVGVSFAATDATLILLSLLILTFIEGAFAWVIVISTGQSAGAARAADMDRRLHRPPRVKRERLGREPLLLPHPLWGLSRLPGHLPPGLGRLKRLAAVVGPPHRLCHQGVARTLALSAPRRTLPALLRRGFPSSAISPCQEFARAIAVLRVAAS